MSIEGFERYNDIPERAVRETIKTRQIEKYKEILQKFPEVEKIPGLLEHLEKIYKTQMTDIGLEKVSVHKNEANAAVYLYKIKFWIGKSINQEIIEDSVIEVFKDGKPFDGQKIFRYFSKHSKDQAPDLNRPELKYQDVRITEMSEKEIVVEATPEQGELVLIKFKED